MPKVTIPREAVNGLIEALEYNTGEKWTERRVKDEFLVPVHKSMLEGDLLFEAETKVLRQLGLLQEATDD